MRHINFELQTKPVLAPSVSWINLFTRISRKLVLIIKVYLGSSCTENNGSSCMPTNISLALEPEKH